MSKFLAYPFLYDKSESLLCDYEILTDEISSSIGFLRSLVKDESLKDELSKINELVYHANASLRTFVSIKQEEVDFIYETTKKYENEVKDRFNKFVLPQGSQSSSFSHILRAKCKKAVRLIHRHKEQGNNVDEIILDFFNLLSGYFFVLALKLNKDENICETEFISRNYK